MPTAKLYCYRNHDKMCYFIQKYFKLYRHTELHIQYANISREKFKRSLILHCTYNCVGGPTITKNIIITFSTRKFCKKKKINNTQQQKHRTPLTNIIVNFMALQYIAPIMRFETDAAHAFVISCHIFLSIARTHTHTYTIYAQMKVRH